MEIFLLICLFIIPILGLYSGLSVAVTTPIFFFVYLYHIRKFLKLKITNYKIELCFFIWIIVSCFWSIMPLNSLFSVTKFLIEILLGITLIQNIKKFTTNDTKIEMTLTISFLITIILFFIEYYTEGIATLSFKSLVEKKISHNFFLHSLDRGMSLLTLLSWLVIGIFLKRRRNLLAIIIYFTMLISLKYSDSLASFVAHIAGGIIFIFTRYITLPRNPKILCCGIIICSISMIIFSFKIDPLQISQETKLLPISAKHRLFIWNFVAENSKNNPILGIGFGSSKNFPVKEEDMIETISNSSPLPLHPHNNVMQVYFELGIIGLIIYLAIICKYLLFIGKNYRTKNSVSKNLISSLYACFGAHWVISMISYSIWQSWWIFALLWISSLGSKLIIPKITQST